METFQKIVLYSAIVILIVILIIIGVAFSYAKNDEQWPPLVPECPDYWISDGSGNNTQCINIKDLGTCPANGTKHLTMNFNDPAFSGDNGDCSKYTWATACNLTWDGITYGVQNPCNS